MMRRLVPSRLIWIYTICHYHYTGSKRVLRNRSKRHMKFEEQPNINTTQSPSVDVRIPTITTVSDFNSSANQNIGSDAICVGASCRRSKRTSQLKTDTLEREGIEKPGEYDIDVEEDGTSKVNVVEDRALVATPGLHSERTLRYSTEDIHEGKGVTTDSNISFEEEAMTIERDVSSADNSTAVAVFPDKSVTSSAQQRTKKYSYNYQCQYCDDKFRYRSPLNLHIFTKHQDRQQTETVCQHCGKRVPSKDELALHIRFACRKRDRPITCSSCNLTFPSEDVCSEHHCTTDVSKPYGCDLCNYKAKLLRDLMEHLTRHNGQKHFLCTTCGASFVTKKDMDRHSFTHKLAKEFQCEDCGSLFKSINNLRKHAVKHKNTNKFQCDQCDYTTSTDFCFKQHLVRHRERQFQCEQCHKTLRSERSLKLHVENRHTFNRIFACQSCDFTTNVGLSFSSHMRLHKERKGIETGETLDEIDALESTPISATSFPEANIAIPVTCPDARSAGSSMIVQAFVSSTRQSVTSAVSPIDEGQSMESLNIGHESMDQTP